jgi:hypothetical protein
MKLIGGRMQYLSGLISDARKSIGGTTYAANRYGLYNRTRTAPVQPRTPPQQHNRAAFTLVTQAWKGLTPAERDAYRVYAETQWKVDSLGQRYRPSGYGVWCETALNLMNATGSLPVRPPDLNDVDHIPQASGVSVFSDGVSTVAIELFIASYDGGEVGGLLVHFTRGLRPTVNFISRHDYRLMPKPYTPGLTLYIFEAQYSDLLGFPAAGTNVGMKLQLINTSTGYGYTPSTSVWPVTFI